MKRHWSHALARLGACGDAKTWAATQKSRKTAWANCERPEWMFWILGKLATSEEDRKRIVLAACACARLALKFVTDDELRPLRAIETVEAWTRGNATIDAAREASRVAAAAQHSAAAAAAVATCAAYSADAAYAAASAADAAYAAASAAYAADAAYAAAAAAAAAAADADAYAYAYVDAARFAMRRACCAEIRRVCPMPVLALRKKTEAA